MKAFNSRLDKSKRIKRINKTLIISICILLFLLPCFNSYALTPQSTDYVLNARGEKRPVPKLYNVVKTLDGYSGLSLKGAEDLFIHQDKIYIADTVANIVYVIDLNGKILKTLTQANNVNFSEPRGIFVNENNEIYIADTLNQRIVLLDKNYDFIKEIKKPESAALETLHSFDVNKIVVSQSGFMYLTRGKDLMQIDNENDFKGYMGSGKVGFSFRNLFVKLFASKEQKNKIVKTQPPPFNNIYYKDGFIFAVAQGSSEQIRRINSVGMNILPSASYGEIVVSKSSSVFRSSTSNPDFVDITVDNANVISAIESQTGKIYQYDFDGNMIGVFGGLGDVEGCFSKPSSIACDSEGRLYVLDSSSNKIQVFEKTEFTQICHNAIKSYVDRDYDKAKEFWEEAVTINANYPIARDALGKIAFKKKDYIKSMSEYKISGNQAEYGEAFGKYRTEMVQNHFGIIATIIILAAVVLIIYIRWIIRRANKISKEFYSKKRQSHKR